jgi:hypothetical protein
MNNPRIMQRPRNTQGRVFHFEGTVYTALRGA